MFENLSDRLTQAAQQFHWQRAVHRRQYQGYIAAGAPRAARGRCCAYPSSRSFIDQYSRAGRSAKRYRQEPVTPGQALIKIIHSGNWSTILGRDHCATRSQGRNHRWSFCSPDCRAQARPQLQRSSRSGFIDKDRKTRHACQCRCTSGRRQFCNCKDLLADEVGALPLRQ